MRDGGVCVWGGGGWRGVWGDRGKGDREKERDVLKQHHVDENVR